MMKNIIILVITIFVVGNLRGQKLVQLLSETITIHSTTHLGGGSRNAAAVTFPAGTISYTYRVSVFKKDNYSISQALFDVLKNMPNYSATLKTAANLSQYIVNNANGGAIDWHILSTEQDKNKFLNYQDWRYCETHPNRSSSCAVSTSCLTEGGTVYFVFRNGNLSEGLDVHFEIVALVGEVKDYYCNITNSTWLPVKFQMSEDGINWNNYSLDGLKTNNLSFKKSNVFFRIIGDSGQTTQYKIPSDKQYKLEYSWSKRTVDLITLN